MKRKIKLNTELEKELEFIESSLEYKYGDYNKTVSDIGNGGKNIKSYNYSAVTEQERTFVSASSLENIDFYETNLWTGVKIEASKNTFDGLFSCKTTSYGQSMELDVSNNFMVLSKGKWSFLRYLDSTLIKYASMHDSISGNDSKVDLNINLNDNGTIDYIYLSVCSNLIENSIIEVKIGSDGTYLFNIDGNSLTTKIDSLYAKMFKQTIVERLRQIKSTSPLVAEDEEILESVICTLMASINKEELDNSYLELSKIKDKQAHILDVLSVSLTKVGVLSIRNKLTDSIDAYYSKVTDACEFKLN